MLVNTPQFELLAPGGDIDSIKAAIAAGADAVYCGLDRFNARNRATNLSLDALKQILPLAHHHQCKIFVTLNIALLESEIPSMVRLLEQLNTTHIDGVIIQDLGLAAIIRQHFPDMDVHASTQLNTHNEGQILFMQQLGVSRVNLARELNIDEIKTLADFGHQHNVLMEVFVHGSYCVGFSGLCYMSSARNGASGNRGRCSQPCRDTYQKTELGIEHPLNMKDNSAYLDVEALANAGVYSLKIEGRIKKPHYVYSVVKQWRQQLNHFQNTQQILTDTTPLYKVFNRDFSDGYLTGQIGKNMLIDNPRNNAANHFAQFSDANAEESLQQSKRWVYDQTTALIEETVRSITAMETEFQAQAETKRKGRVVPFQPLAKTNQALNSEQKLAVLIDSPQQVEDLAHQEADLYYQLPNNIAKQLPSLIKLFNAQSRLIPWFPSVIIGEDYRAAQQLLEQCQPEVVVTNNTGIAYLARQMGIKWIAGPQLNLMNGYALQTLKQEFGCCGAFISNEINQAQIKRITPPEDFALYYSIYHPNDVMVSRQCLFQQTSGCKKIKVNKGCLPRCEKHTSIINLNGSAYVIDKKRGEFNHIYANQHYLNSQVLQELPDKFQHLLIDLREVKTETRSALNAAQLVQLFEQALQTKDTQSLHQAITNTECNQYKKGL